jgi:flagellar biosynthesis component FlhA
MRKLALLFSTACFLLACSNDGTGKQKTAHQHDSTAEQQKKDTTKKSIPSESKKWIGNTEIKINYHSPAVRGRVIWGGLVPYDAVWVTGAHSATTFELGKDFQVGDKTIPAGKYALFTIPGKEEWTIILNKNWDQHLADDYSETEDIVRVKVKPGTTDEIIERLKYEIDQSGERTANIIISWEKIRISFPVEIR